MEDSQEENSSGSVYARYRSPTFSHKEIKALLDIIDKYKTIVLNKNTSGAASRAKEVTWLKIAKIFNSQGFKHTRSAECLKMKWLNLKQNVKKMSSNLIDAGTSEIDEVAKQTMMIICEAENNTSMVNEPTASELELIIEEHRQEINDSHWNGNGSKESFESTDGDNENESRYRSPTFTQCEVKALLKIIDKYKTVLLNKSVSASANQAKEVAWTKIAKIFNSQGFKHTRTAFNLKTKWGNLKRELRNVPDNSNGAKTSEFDELVRQGVAKICEAESNMFKVEEPMDSDSDFNFNEEIEEDKQTNESNCNGNEDRVSDESMDDENENEECVKRSMNFSQEECNLLLQCVKPEKHIVFSKKTSSSVNKIKNLAWTRIRNSYNKLSPQKRSTKVLRTKFTNMKRQMTKVKFRDYIKDLGVKHPKEEKSDQFQKIKSEPLFDCKGDPEREMEDDVTDHNGTDLASDHDSYSNHAHDPLSAVLTDSGIGSINLSENKEVVKLKLELLNYKLETAKLKRKRLQDLAQSEAAEREMRAVENSLRLRAARLEVAAAEMKLPPTHHALAYTPEEARAQHYIHQYHAT